MRLACFPPSSIWSVGLKIGMRRLRFTVKHLSYNLQAIPTDHHYSTLSPTCCIQDSERLVSLKTGWSNFALRWSPWTATSRSSRSTTITQQPRQSLIYTVRWDERTCRFRQSHTYCRESLGLLSKEHPIACGTLTNSDVCSWTSSMRLNSRCVWMMPWPVF